jgi:hypothetical protein
MGPNYGEMVFQNYIRQPRPPKKMAAIAKIED